MKDPNIKRVLVIGSGPIVIGQAAEFDYAGTQACKALREDGIEVILVNSNPATIMTDKEMADKIYIEPLTLTTVKRIIDKEKPDSVLSTLGGQTGLTLSMLLAKQGFLKSRGVKLLGAKVDTIDKAEDRRIFKETMIKIGQPVIPSIIAEDLETAVDFGRNEGYPLIIRPAFTLGGSGGGMVMNEEEMRITATKGLELSPIHQVLVEKSVAGWKEIEFEVIRDASGAKIIVCDMENVDPCGVHTGDSIVTAPTFTLEKRELDKLRKASLDIVEELGIEGGCNVQLALCPDTHEYVVIEVNPRVSRSSALASKATGYPIARVAAKLAIGYNLNEIHNAVCGAGTADKEPKVEYTVLKFPRWPFDKFIHGDRRLGTQMKATGEVMTIGENFETAMMKAVRGLEIKANGLSLKKFRGLTKAEVAEKLKEITDERMFVVYEALKRGIDVEHIFEVTKITRWFLQKLKGMADLEKELQNKVMGDELYLRAKKMGYPDDLISELNGVTIKRSAYPSYRTINTCGAQSIENPYFYSVYGSDCEAKAHIEKKQSDKKTVVVFGSGPIRIGQGIEFDYASVHCITALKKLGYEVVTINNNPETVSTDYDTSDRLYFEALTPEDVAGVLEVEKPYGVVVAFGGQTAIKLTNYLLARGENILGTSADSIDIAEDRQRFDALMGKLHIKRPKGSTVMTKQQAVAAAKKIGYPVLVRPSYVLGGQNMIIAHNASDVEEYMDLILSSKIDNPVLIDKYLMGTEIEVDAICDGKDVLIPGVMEHVERTGVHSGDSIAVYPTFTVDDGMLSDIVKITKKIALGLKTVGLINIQYLIYEGKPYVIEVNPRSSRTVPYISKITGIPMVDLAVRCMHGEPLRSMGFGTGLYKTPPYTAVKVPVFSFEKLANVDTLLGPEMKSTGEVLGIGHNLEEALYKGLVAAGYKMKTRGGAVLFTVRDSDKEEAAAIARKFADLGYTVYATKGTKQALLESETEALWVGKIGADDFNCQTVIERGMVDYIVSTDSKGRSPSEHSVKIRRLAAERRIPCLTSMDTADALVSSLRSRYSEINTELVDIANMRKERQRLKFVKMQSCGNDYIYFDCIKSGRRGTGINNPEGLAAALSDRNFGIGGDGIVMLEASGVAACKARIFNLDGSEGQVSGNALRCAGKYLYENKYTRKKSFDIEDTKGVKRVELNVANGLATSATVNLGRAKFKASNVPVNTKSRAFTTSNLNESSEIIGMPAYVGGQEYRINCVSLGNPHCIVFLPGVDKLDLNAVGQYFENSDMFPDKVDVGFVKVINDTALKMRVWERTNGEILACGTGAAAAVAAAVKNGICKKNKDIRVKQRGGDLIVRYTDDAVYVTGSAEKVFAGEVEL